MSNINWHYYFARKFSVQRWEIVLRVFRSPYFFKHFEVRLKNMLVKPEQGGNQAIWLDPDEFLLAKKKIFNTVYRNQKSFQFYKEEIKKTQQAWVTAAKNISTEVNQSLENPMLGKLYRRFIAHHLEHFIKPIWIIFSTEPLISEAASQALKKVLKRNNAEKEFTKWISIIFSPEEKNAITATEHDVVQLAILIKKNKLQKSQVDDHLKTLTKEHGYIPCYDVIDKPWDTEHFQKELDLKLKKSLRGLKTDDRELRTRFQNHAKNFRYFLRNFTMTKREREIFIMAHEVIFLKDERDDYRRLGSFYGRKLYEEIGRRLHLSAKEVAFSTISETENYLFKGILPPAQEIRDRLEGFLLFSKKGGPITIVSGQKMNRVLQKETNMIQTKNTTILRGIVASVGKARGSVIIIRTKHDLRRMHAGAIMVAVTTNPDYVPAMRHCKAIVTDEGGITSHAAIVSRELKIPCLVGTKSATQVFKDGDLVEVDANKGIVQKQ